MKIAVISDTHIKEDLSYLENFLENELLDMDFIVHAGDILSTEAIRLMKSYKRFSGVYGNVDQPDTRNRLKEVEIINIHNFRIGIFHGHGKGKDTLQRTIDKFKNNEIDIVIYGHSHMPNILTKNGILCINPGSPSCKRKEKWYSYIVLTLFDNEINAELRFSPFKFFNKK